MIAVVYPGHPRFITIAQNIRQRRGRKVIINWPIFKDTKTKDPFIEVFGDEESDSASKADHIYLDAMGFGMGCCCLQVTFQASNIREARVLYDQLTPVCPIAMALSAASPVHRGYLTDRDCRWGIISASVDDRTKEELGEEPLRNNSFRINKSRYDSIDSYLCETSDKYNDILLTYNKEYYEEMVSEGVDPILAKHIAHLFIRDPLVVYREKLEQNDEIETDHFEVSIITISSLSTHFLILFLVFFAEHTIDELANHALQTASTSVVDRLESRVQTNGSADD